MATICHQILMFVVTYVDQELVLYCYSSCCSFCWCWGDRDQK